MSKIVQSISIRALFQESPPHCRIIFRDPCYLRMYVHICSVEYSTHTRANTKKQLKQSRNFFVLPLENTGGVGGGGVLLHDCE